MSLSSMTSPITTGVVGRHRTRFVAVHREDTTSPAVVAVTVTVPMSVEDITAALWLVVTREQVTDLAEFTGHPAMVHELVCETLVAQGADQITRARRAVAGIRPGHPHHPTVTQLRDLITQLYTPRALGGSTPSRTDSPRSA